MITRILQLSRATQIAIILVIGMVLWIGSAVIAPPSKDDEGDAAPQVSEPDLEKAVEVTRVYARPHNRSIILYGQTAPNRRVELKAETQGTVVAIPGVEGQKMAEGDVIVRIDERDRRAQLEQARALLNQREIENKAAVRLQAKGFQTEVRLAEAKARLAEARANLKRIELDLHFTKMRAPFDGILEELNVEIGDFVGVGVFGGEGALAVFVDNDPLKITGQVSENDRPLIRMGSPAKVMLSDGRELRGTVAYLANVAESASRTFRIEVELQNPDQAIPAGMTAELRIPTEAVKAFFISPSALALDDDGKIGVKIVDEENIVRFRTVELLEDTEDGMWITGLPDAVKLITLGQTFVSPGQRYEGEVLEGETYTPVLEPLEQVDVPEEPVGGVVMDALPADKMPPVPTAKPERP
ncbi:MAG: efflux transporter periplasmic adaptor subunit [Rickettsiales bacterium]|nr:efflux transporter periplasmic adaptor subunit [Rickettsiales bacterium]